jgi:hypothetical protein
MVPFKKRGVPMPKNISIPLKDLKSILGGDNGTISKYTLKYGDMREFEYPISRLEERYWKSIVCEVCGKLCKGEHGYRLHSKIHKK